MKIATQSNCKQKENPRNSIASTTLDCACKFRGRRRGIDPITGANVSDKRPRPPHAEQLDRNPNQLKQQQQQQQQQQ